MHYFLLLGGGVIVHAPSAFFSFILSFAHAYLLFLLVSVTKMDLRFDDGDERSRVSLPETRVPLQQQQQEQHSERSSQGNSNTAPAESPSKIKSSSTKSHKDGGKSKDGSSSRGKDGSSSSGGGDSSRSRSREKRGRSSPAPASALGVGPASGVSSSGRQSGRAPPLLAGMPSAPPLKGDRGGSGGSKEKVREDTPAGATTSQRSGKSSSRDRDRDGGGSRSRERGRDSTKEGKERSRSPRNGQSDNGSGGERSRDRNKSTNAPPLPATGRRPSPLRQVLENDSSHSSSQVCACARSFFIWRQFLSLA